MRLTIIGATGTLHRRSDTTPSVVRLSPFFEP